jgi:shikimate kinase
VKHIFLIGPGGVGKTTIGRLFAPLLNLQFIDLDEEFCTRIGSVRSHLDRYGYLAQLNEAS